MNLILFKNKQDSYTLPRNDRRYRHIREILRSIPGETLKVGVLDGPVGEAHIRVFDEERIELDARWHGAMPAPPAPVTILLGHPRPPVLKRLWRDLSSLGVRKIRVFTGELGERSYLTSSAWDDPDYYLLEGLSQGGHTRPPQLTRHARLAEAIAAHGTGNTHETDTRTGEARFFGTLGAGDALSLREMLTGEMEFDAVTLCIGPERGLTDDEELLLRRNGYCPVSLGPRTLRTETATVLLAGAACSVCSVSSGT